MPRSRERRRRRASNILLHLALPFALAAIAASPACGQLIPGIAGGDPSRPLTAASLVKVSVVADVDGIRPGATFHLAVIFEIEPHWHIYWCDPGASGAPTEVSVTAPEGYTISPTVFPRPVAFPDPAGLTYGYERETVLFVPVTAPAELAAEAVTFDVDVFYFVCRERCLIGQTKRSLELPVTNEGGGGHADRDRGRDRRRDRVRAETARLDRFKQRLPRPLATLGGGRASLHAAGDGARLVLTGSTRGFRDVSFFPIASPGVVYGTPEISIDDETFRISVPLEVTPRNALGQPMVTRGVVALGKSPDQPSYDFVIPIDGSSAISPRETER